MKSRFKQLRQDAGLTQEEFRIQFNNKYHRNYTPSAISRFENDKRIPETTALMDFADFFGVTVDYLLGRDTEMHKEHEMDKVYTGLSKEATKDTKLQDLIRLYPTLNDTAKTAIDSILELAKAQHPPKE